MKNEKKLLWRKLLNDPLSQRVERRVAAELSAALRTAEQRRGPLSREEMLAIAEYIGGRRAFIIRLEEAGILKAPTE